MPGHSQITTENTSPPTTDIISSNPPTSPEYLVDEGETNGYLTEILYNYAGQKTSLTTPDMGTWGYEYDPSGNLSTQTDARGCEIDMLYDSLNRLTEKS